MCKILVHFSTWKKQKYNNALEIYNILLCSVEYVKVSLILFYLSGKYTCPYPRLTNVNTAKSNKIKL